LSFFITTDQYIHYYALYTLHIFTMEKKNHYAKRNRDAAHDGATAVQRGEAHATRAVAQVSRLISHK